MSLGVYQRDSAERQRAWPSPVDRVQADTQPGKRDECGQECRLELNREHGRLEEEEDQGHQDDQVDQDDQDNQDEHQRDHQDNPLSRGLSEGVNESLGLLLSSNSNTRLRHSSRTQQKITSSGLRNSEREQASAEIYQFQDNHHHLNHNHNYNHNQNQHHHHHHHHHHRHQCAGQQEGADLGPTEALSLIERYPFEGADLRLQKHLGAHRSIESLLPQLTRSNGNARR